jgi:hypothetical protein
MEVWIMRSSALFTVALLSAAFAACAAGDREAGAGFGVRDSAGVRIVESHRPRWGAGEGWVVEAMPSLQLGAVEGDTPESFARVVDALRLPDGTIVVADGGNTELRFFDGGGRFLRGVGREGKGPGEFEGIAQLANCGADSIIAWDPWLRRASVFDSRGEYVRGVTLEAPSASGVVYGRWGCGSEGEVVLMGWPRTDGIPQGPHRPLVPVALSQIGDGRITVELGEFPGDDRYGYPGGSGPAPFGRRTHLAMGAGLAYLGTGDSYEIRGYRLDGALEVVLRRPAAVRAVSREDLARYRELDLAQVSDPELRRRRERRLLEMEFPTTFPAYAALRTDPAGRLWIQRYAPPGEAGTEWAVFEPDGEWLGDVVMPEGLEVYEIGRDYVLGKWRDELGVDYLRVHGLGADRSEIS